ncbi:hypothetical protein Daus18300_005592 [Diaporthe australafricana]|uniref:Secreted protein n=1 Tax=Diaporthe australafricana TaxID=127596 RepID=A0ABR3X0F1_9PEZI
MKRLAIIIAVLTALLLASGSQVPVPTSAISPPIAHYTMVDISWAVESYPGNASSTVHLNGTAQEVIQQLIEINPEYPVDDSPIEGLKNTIPDAAANTPPGANEKPSTSEVCTARWSQARYTEINNGIRHLRHLQPGRPAMGPGPAACGRVSCSYDSAIWWCNDNSERKELDAWDHIADFAEVILHLCQWQDDGEEYFTRGQLFDSEGWNVIVRGDSC